MLESAVSEDPRLIRLKLFSKFFNLCDHNSSTSHSDGRMTCRDNTVLCVASRGKNCYITPVLMSHISMHRIDFHLTRTTSQQLAKIYNSSPSSTQYGIDLD